MGFRGVLIILTLLAVYPKAQAEGLCKSYFSASNELIEKIDAIASVPRAKQNLVLVPVAPLNEQAQARGLDLMLTRGLFNTYQIDANIGIKSKENLKMGDALITLAKAFAQSAKLKYRMSEIQVNGVTKSVMVISTEGSHPLNREARILAEDYRVKTVYNPYELLRGKAGAMVESTTKTFWISEEMLARGSIQKTADGKHELTHIQILKMYEEGKLYYMHGEMTALKGLLPGTSNKAYSKYQSFEEPDAMWNGASAALKELMNFMENSKSLKTDKEKKIYKGMILEKFKTQLQNGVTTSTRTLYMANQALKQFETLKDVVHIEQKTRGYYSVRWDSTLPDSTYRTEIPLLSPKGDATREDLAVLLKTDLEMKAQISKDRIEFFKSALDIFHQIKNISLLEARPLLLKLEESFSQLENN